MCKGYHLFNRGYNKGTFIFMTVSKCCFLTKTSELYLEEKRNCPFEKSGILESLFFAVLLLQFINERGTSSVKIGIIIRIKALG